MPTQTFMFDRIIQYLMSKTVIEAEERTLRNYLLDFSLIHGRESIQAMYGAIRYHQVKSPGTEAILNESLRHDILGRNETAMLPRTQPYAEFATL
jgi:hypothetical protein